MGDQMAWLVPSLPSTTWGTMLTPTKVQNSLSQPDLGLGLCGQTDLGPSFTSYVKV